MSHATRVSRVHGQIRRLEAWAHRSPLRSLVVKAGVTVVGPLVVLAGIAMIVLPGPGLVVISLGLALLALEYEWARRVLRKLGRTLASARDVALPQDGTRGRRGLGVAMIGVVGVAGFVATTAITTFLGTQAIL